MMIYKCPGSVKWDNGMTFDWKNIPAGDIPEGWHRTVFDAHDAMVKADQSKEDPKENEPPTRSEMEQKATELGLKFDGRTSDRKLAAMIQEALK